jgi:hypothetical protein
MVGVLSVLVVSCSGQNPSIVPDQPIQVVGGQFFVGALPGKPPWMSIDDASEDPADLTQRAIITNGETISGPTTLPLVAGAEGQAFSGYATSDTVAIGVEMEGSTGYWVTVAGGPVPMHPGVEWSVHVNFDPADSPGRHALRFVAIDAAGSAGTQVEASVCIDSIVPDNQHACSPNQVPPSAVISLRWDDDFDLDLHVLTPDGTDINPRHPFIGPTDAGAPQPGSSATLCSPLRLVTYDACIDRDSLASCIPDGHRQEDLIFTDPPVPGAYGIYVDPFAPCGQTGVRFTVSVYTLAGACPNCGLVQTFAQSGAFAAFQVSGGTGTGLFIKQIELPQGR